MFNCYHNRCNAVGISSSLSVISSDFYFTNTSTMVESGIFSIFSDDFCSDLLFQAIKLPQMCIFHFRTAPAHHRRQKTHITPLCRVFSQSLMVLVAAFGPQAREIHFWKQCIRGAVHVHRALQITKARIRLEYLYAP